MGGRRENRIDMGIDLEWEKVHITHSTDHVWYTDNCSYDVIHYFTGADRDCSRRTILAKFGFLETGKAARRPSFLHTQNPELTAKLIPTFYRSSTNLFTISKTIFRFCSLPLNSFGLSAEVQSHLAPSLFHHLQTYQPCLNQKQTLLLFSSKRKNFPIWTYWDLNPGPFTIIPMSPDDEENGCEAKIIPLDHAPEIWGIYWDCTGKNIYNISVTEFEFVLQCMSSIVYFACCTYDLSRCSAPLPMEFEVYFRLNES